MTTGLAWSMDGYLRDLPVIDCHEHTMLPDRRPEPLDVGTLIAGSDLGDDLIACGMPAADRQRLSFEVAAPWLDRVRNTGFYRSIVLALESLFGYEGDLASAADWDDVSLALIDANARDDWYDEVLGRRGHIERILRIQGDEPHPFDIPRQWFDPIVRFDDWITTSDGTERETLAASVGGRAGTLDEFLAAMEAAFDAAVEGGAVGAKSMLAYRRSLAHGRPARGEAARLFTRRTPDECEATALQDFLLHAAVDMAGRRSLPYQIHVGIGSWQRDVAANANPLLLGPLIEAHRDTTFVLLHGGYPFIDEMAALAKTHPNVVLECGWLAYIGPTSYRRAMTEWLDAVPASKLLAFGADCQYVEQTLGALLLTRRLLASALEAKVHESDWSATLAESVARRVLADNAREVYRLREGGAEPRIDD